MYTNKETCQELVKYVNMDLSNTRIVLNQRNGGVCIDLMPTDTELTFTIYNLISGLKWPEARCFLLGMERRGYTIDSADKKVYSNECKQGELI